MRIPPRFGDLSVSVGLLALSALMLGVAVSAAPVPVPSPASLDYRVELLTSDGSLPAAHVDPTLKNGWGLAAGGAGPWWVAVNEAQASMLFDADGTPQNLRVAIPGAPTGIVRTDGEGFLVTDGDASAPARFLFATEDGTIAGWSPDVGPAAPMQSAFTVVSRASAGAIYKGLALARTIQGDRLYATDFHNGRVDVFDDTYKLVNTLGGFVDPKLPEGYAPFGIQNIFGRIFVSYAKQDAHASDEINGRGLGLVDVFDLDGMLLTRVATHGFLNAPWGMAIAPEGFGEFSGQLLVGNFGDGTIEAFARTDDMRKFTPSGLLRDAFHRPIRIDGLWGIAFGNGAAAGPANALYFAAGPSDESHGSFGRVVANTTR